MLAPPLSNPVPSSAPLSTAQIDAALAVVTRAWPDERTGAVALVAAVLGLEAADVADWHPERLDSALQAVADRLNAWADDSHAAGLARLRPKARKRVGRPLTEKRKANLLKFHSPKAMAPSVPQHIGGRNG